MLSKKRLSYINCSRNSTSLKGIYFFSLKFESQCFLCLLAFITLFQYSIGYVKFCFNSYSTFIFPSFWHNFMKRIFIQDKIKTNLGMFLVDQFFRYFFYDSPLYCRMSTLSFIGFIACSVIFCFASLCKVSRELISVPILSIFSQS